MAFKGQIVIDTERCKGCAVCLAACPVQCIALSKNVNGKGYNYCTVDQCLKPGVIEYFRNGTVTGEVPEAKLKALKNSLAKNALTAGNFNPGQGFTFFHSTRDEVVPFCNLESVRNSWGSSNIKALSYNSGTYLHVGTGTAFFLYYCGDYVNEILKNNWAPCEDTVGGKLWAPAA